MNEKTTKNYNVIIGDRKRTAFVIKPSSAKKTKSSVKRSRSCGGCSRKRKVS
ncbi:MAG TPA: hypothetical protein VMZ91_00475 [Candidatus Paceibacterota bacterium]|nr:hypothetical protein [Candidatus Paceibacterota bacterium]